MRQRRCLRLCDWCVNGLCWSILDTKEAENLTTDGWCWSGARPASKVAPSPSVLITPENGIAASSFGRSCQPGHRRQSTEKYLTFLFLLFRLVLDLCVLLFVVAVVILFFMFSFLILLLLLLLSSSSAPWYNRTGWLGAKHQVTYLLSSSSSSSLLTFFFFFFFPPEKRKKKKNKYTVSNPYISQIQVVQHRNWVSCVLKCNQRE